MILNEYLGMIKDQLERRNIDEDEKEDILQYIEEMITDRVENGESEDEVIASLGAADKLIDDLFPDAKVFYDEKEELARRKNVSFMDVKKIDIDSANYDFSFAVCDDDQVYVEYDSDEYLSLDIRFDHGILKIDQHNSVQGMGYLFTSLSKMFSKKGIDSSRKYEAIINLPKCCDIKFDIDNVSGDMRFADITGYDMKLESVSGDLYFESCDFTKLKIESVSGDIEMNDVTVENRCKLQTISGDIKAEELESKEIRIETVSGDVGLLIRGERSDTDVKVEKPLNETKSKVGGSRYLKIETVSGSVNWDFTD